MTDRREPEALEIEAIDIEEWEAGQRTPEANDAKLEALVRQTATMPAVDRPGAPEPPRRTATIARAVPKIPPATPAPVEVKRELTPAPKKPAASSSATPAHGASTVMRATPAKPIPAAEPIDDDWNDASFDSPTVIPTKSPIDSFSAQTVIRDNSVALAQARRTTPPAGVPADRGTPPGDTSVAKSTQAMGSLAQTPPKRTPPAGIPAAKPLEPKATQPLPPLGAVEPPKSPAKRETPSAGMAAVGTPSTKRESPAGWVPSMPPAGSPAAKSNELKPQGETSLRGTSIVSASDAPKHEVLVRGATPKPAPELKPPVVAEVIAKAEVDADAELTTPQPIVETVPQVAQSLSSKPGIVKLPVEEPAAVEEFAWPSSPGMVAVAPPVATPDGSPVPARLPDPPKLAEASAPLAPMPMAHAPPRVAQAPIAPAPVVVVPTIAPQVLPYPSVRIPVDDRPRYDERRVPTDAGPPRRRLAAIIGGAAGAVVILIIVIAVAKSGGTPEPVETKPAPTATKEPAPTQPDPPVVAVADPDQQPTTPTNVATPDPTAKPTKLPVQPIIRTGPPGTIPKKPAIATKPGNSGKPEVAVKTGPDISTLRAAYNTGNQRLFVGDTTGAIKAYQQTITLAPGYAPGYRGLGLAYAQAGDRPRAVTALKRYIALAPKAKDVPLIQNRITALLAGR